MYVHNLAKPGKLGTRPGWPSGRPKLTTGRSLVRVSHRSVERIIQLWVLIDSKEGFSSTATVVTASVVLVWLSQLRRRIFFFLSLASLAASYSLAVLE